MTSSQWATGLIFAHYDIVPMGSVTKKLVIFTQNKIEQ